MLTSSSRLLSSGWALPSHSLRRCLSAAAPTLPPIPCEGGGTVQPWSTPTREAQLARLRGEEFDMVVVGGGCVGAGVAWEATTRGLKVALVEQQDFSSGTSGRSTKLIHGGIRYLEAAFKNLDPGMYHLVQEALEERAHLMNAAPFMAQPLATLIPLHSWWEVPYVWAGTKVYDWLAGSKRFVPPSSFVSAEEALRQFPMLAPAGLKGAIVYYDGKHNDTRMNVLLVLTAVQAGAAALNYAPVTSITKCPRTGAATGVSIQDSLTGERIAVRARTVVNATGCFADALRAMDTPTAAPLIQGASGVHLVLPGHCVPERLGLIIPRTSDGRVLFLLPWEGGALAGTTDAPCAISMAPRPAEADIEFILAELNRHLRRPVQRRDVQAAWSGIRPLLRDPKANPALTGTAALSRTHVVETSPSGMVSIMGGKWTTYRRMAEDAVEAAAEVAGWGKGKGSSGSSSSSASASASASASPSAPPSALPLQLRPSTTSKLQVLGADRQGRVLGRQQHRLPVLLQTAHGLDGETARHLASNYGTRALCIAGLVAKDAALGARLAPRHPVLAAEVVFGVQQEYARSVEDVLARRTRLAYLDAAAARSCVGGVAQLMAPLLGWSAEERGQQERQALAFLDTMDGPARAQ